MDQNDSSLADRITDSVKNFMSALPEDEAQTVAGSFEKLYASQVAAKAVAVGDSAPDFTLPNVTGEPVNLYEALGHGPRKRPLNQSQVTPAAAAEVTTTGYCSISDSSCTIARPSTGSSP